MTQYRAESLVNLLGLKLEVPRLSRVPSEIKATPSLQAVRAALACIPPDDRALWVKIGIALRYSYGEAARQLWIEWGSKSKKWEDEDADLWAGFDRNNSSEKPVTADTILWEARQHGYVSEFSVVEGSDLTALSLSELLNFEFKKRDPLVEPVITTQSLTMFYGPRGVGKTRFNATLAIAAASGGGAFNWSAPRPVKTLYLDGEMAGAEFQGLLRTLRHLAPPDWPGDTLRVFTPDVQSGGIPDLSTVEGQQRIEQIFDDAELIFIDNLSAWVRGAGEENSAESWAPMLEWLMRLRQQGRSVVLLHHAGKNGSQRGTSKREDVLDVVLALRRPANYSPDEGARFEVHFEKARSLHGDAVAPFEARFEVDSGGIPSWHVRALKVTHTQRILELHQTGMIPAQIAKELGVARSTVTRAIERNSMPPVDEK